MTTLSQSASNIVLNIFLMVVWLFVGRGIWRSNSRSRELALTNECERLKTSCDNLTIGRHTFENEASDLRKSNSELLTERDKAREANKSLRQGWDKTLSEVKPILKDNSSLQLEATQLKNIVACDDRVKAISEALIRELETKLSDSQIACEQASVSVVKASDYIVELKDKLKDAEMRADLAEEMVHHAREHIKGLEEQFSKEADNHHEERRRHSAAVDLHRSLQLRVDELENALQTIKGCVDDQLTESHVEMES